MVQITVKKSDIRLDSYILANCPDINISLLNKYNRENKIKVNGKKKPLNTRLICGDLINLYLPDKAKSETLFFENIYEDNNVIIVAKPAGIPVNGEEKCLENHVKNYIKNHNENVASIYPCHRLDTGTSGLVIFAKNSETKDEIDTLIKDRAIKKQYVCLTYGVPNKTHELLHAYITKNPEDGIVFVSLKKTPHSKEITTEYELLAARDNIALLNITLVTGRTHQIRAHLAFIGCPILGDSKYGINKINRGYKFRYQALCAYKIVFPKINNKSCIANLSLREFTSKKPWYQEAFENEKPF